MMTPLECTGENPPWDDLLPSVEECIELMEREWLKHNKAVSDRSRRRWRGMFEKDRQQIIDFDDPHKRDRITVETPCCGSGKSLSRIVFATLLCRSAAPGTTAPRIGGRIVVKTTAEADAMAKKISELAEEFGYTGLVAFAESWHAKGKRKVAKAERAEYLEHLNDTPIIVSCHRGLEISMGHLSMEGRETDEAQAISTYRGEPRRWLVIDECINFISVATVDVNTVEHLIVDIPSRLKQRFASTVSWMRETIDRNTGKESICLDGILLPGGKPPDLTGLRREMRFTGGTASARAKYEEALTMLYSFVRTWTRSMKAVRDGKEITLVSSSKNLLGPGTRGGIVTDATARTSKKTYEMFGDRVDMDDAGELKNHRDVTVYAAKGHNVGKNTIAKGTARMETIAQELLRNLPQLNGRKGLILTHMAFEAVIKKRLPRGSGWETSHWGLHDGTNDWTDRDVIVIYGLKILPDEYGITIYDGYSPPGEDPKHTEEERKKICDILKEEACAVAAIQGAQRGACRRTDAVDEDGQEVAGAMELYLLVPNDSLGAMVLKGLEDTMPDCVMAEWDYNGVVTRSKKKEEVEKRKMEPKPEKDPEGIPKVLAYLLNMEPGLEHRVYRKELEEKCGVCDRTARSVSTLLHKDHPSVLPLVEAGVFVSNDEMDNRVYFEKREV